MTSWRSRAASAILPPWIAASPHSSQGRPTPSLPDHAPSSRDARGVVAIQSRKRDPATLDRRVAPTPRRDDRHQASPTTRRHRETPVASWRSRAPSAILPPWTAASPHSSQGRPTPNLPDHAPSSRDARGVVAIQSPKRDPATLDRRVAPLLAVTTDTKPPRPRAVIATRPWRRGDPEPQARSCHPGSPRRPTPRSDDRHQASPTTRRHRETPLGVVAIQSRKRDPATMDRRIAFPLAMTSQRNLTQTALMNIALSTMRWSASQANRLRKRSGI